MFDFKKLLKKEKKIKEKDFIILDFAMQNTKKKSNIIKIYQKYIFFKII